MADEGVIDIGYLFSLFLLFLSITSTIKCSANDEKHRVNVIVIGGTGDLAKKYLWHGLFDLYRTIRETERKITLRLYGAAREANEKGNAILENILRHSVKCAQEDCEIMKREFLKLCRYLRLKVETDYEELQGILEGNMEVNEVEIGRLFYLSVPPFTYDNISRYIHSRCRPKHKNVWLRVVIEKPLGSNFKTAQELAEKLSKYWTEEEIYRIDHYLGKSGVRQITEFRNKNRFLDEKIWNRDYIEQVNIVVKETDDVEGRMGFYDHYGVIRDVFQNHLTEILILVASELHDSDKTGSNTKKSEFLKSLRIVSLQDALFGQYQEYNIQLRKQMSGNNVKDSNTATFSAVLMHVDNERWFGVPFVMVSGKSLDRRVAYVQIQFKRTAFCISSDMKNRHSNCQPKDIIFYIQSDELNSPVTAISKSLPEVNLPDSWTNLNANINSTSSIFQSDKVFIKPPLAHCAYCCLIREVFLGNKNMFVSEDDLIVSWKIWTPLLALSTVVSPRLYTSKKIEELDFEVVKGKMKFVAEKINDKCERLSSTYMRSTSHSFRGKKLYSGPATDVIQQLANDITAEAQVKVRSGGTFHLALSGGSTPKRLYQILAYAMDTFPWQQTHVWFVDERCVSLSHDQSNFRGIYESLLKYVSVPYVNIHAMPVDIAGRWCQKEDKSDLMYEQLLEYYTGNGSLDFVILGVGNDGHTASLFPHKDALKSSRWVELTSHDFHQRDLSRMTLTLPVLNRAKNVAVLILGKSKIEIVKKLSDEAVVDVDSVPITGVRPVNGSLSWYIDDDALEVVK